MEFAAATVPNRATAHLHFSMAYRQCDGGTANKRHCKRDHTADDHDKPALQQLPAWHV